MYPSITTLILIPALIASASTAALNTTSELEARDKWAFQPSSLSIKFFTSINCMGEYKHVEKIAYGVNNNPYSFASFKLNRFLAKGEQLDFSTSENGVDKKNGIDPYCQKNVGQATFGGQGDPTKCQTFNGASAACFRLWHS